MEDLCKQRLVSLTLFPEEVMEKIVLESTVKPRKDEKVMGSGRRGFTKGKWCLTDLRVSYVEGTSSVDEERAAAGVYSSFLVKPLTLSLLAWS